MKTVLYCVRLEETNWSEDTFYSMSLDESIEIHFTEMDTR